MATRARSWWWMLAPWPAAFWAGCPDEAGTDALFDIEAAVSEAVPTVVDVRWEVDAEAPEDARIEFGPDDGYGMVAPVELDDGAPYEALLLGSPQSTDVHYRVVATVGGEELASDDRVVSTGTLPASLPELTVEVDGEGVDEGGFLVTSTFTEPGGAAIIDRQGRFVWWHSVFDEDAQISRARLSDDRSSMLYWTVNLRDPASDGVAQELVEVALDGTVLRRVSLDLGHHDFCTLPDGTVAYLEYDERPAPGTGEPVVGDRVVELAPDGTTTTIYSVWRDFEYEPGEPLPGQEWSHCNALDYLEEEDAYLVSSLGFDSLFLVDRADGELRWVLGGDETDFDGADDLFSHQHQFELLGDEVLVFDNGAPERHASRVVGLSLDTREMVAEQTWSYDPEPEVYVFSLVDVHRFDSGHTLVTFSTAGQIDELDAEGELVWRLNLDLGGVVGYVTHHDSLYP